MPSEVAPTSAIFNGTVNPNGPELTVCEVEYGTSTSYEEAVPCTGPGELGTSPLHVEVPLGELTPGTTYDYRLVAGNPNVTEYGTNRTFETPAETTTTTTTTRSSSSTSSAEPLSSPVQPVAAAPCRSTRVETISWHVHPRSFLRRILVTRNGVLYRVLNGGTRRVNVSLVGMLKGTVLVRITGIGRDGRRYMRSVAFHTCVSAAAGGGHAGSGVPFLTRGLSR